MTMFEKEFKKVVGIEGEYSDHQNDPGGKTAFGITEELARQYGYEGPMDEMPISKAREIYKTHFWDWLNLDFVSQIAPLTAQELFESGVNVGRRQAWRWMQMSLNALNDQEEDYDDIETDGWPGRNTRRALMAYIQYRGENGDKVLSRAIDSAQGWHYLQLSQNNSKFEDFTFGWFLQRID